MSNTLAQLNATTLPTYFPPARTFGTVGSLLNVVVPALTLVGALGMLFILMYAGFKILTGGGDPEKLVEARQMATWAIVGLIVITLAFFIVRLVAYVLQVQVPV
jgi:hypothetical protein